MVNQADSDREHLLTPVLHAVETAPNRPMVSVRVGDGFVDRSSTEVWDRVVALARGLIAAGVGPGARVALMSATRVEWLEVDLAVNAIGAVTVPIYDTSSAEQVEWILTDSQADLMVAETEAMAALAEGVEHVRVVTIAGGGLDRLADEGEATEPAAVSERLEGLDGDAIATLIYTSGTTGRPKGCVLTHGNLRSNVAQITDALGDTFGPADTTVVFLPLAHILSKTTVAFALERGVRIAFGTSLAELPNEFQMMKPTVIAAVPRIFEKVFAKAQQSAAEGHKTRLFDKAVSIAQRWSQQRMAGHVSPLVRAEHAVFDPVVYSKVRAAFGGELKIAFSGGSPLDEDLCSFFDGAGVRVFEGYGLTETSPILTINRLDGWKPGTVGLPVADTEITLAEDDEILVKGPQVFGGYWRNEAATAEAFDEEGRFRTGDVGQFDDEGFLRIVGRKKELIVTSAGKNVAPEPLENRLRSHRLISQAMVVGDNRPFIAALVTIDEEAIVEWQTEVDLEFKALPELIASPELRAEIDEAVHGANESVSRAESIREFRILPSDLSPERGEVTPTLKVRRMAVHKNWRPTIEEIYEPSS
ncbi:MAG: long-chain fatty acid--CoA ligase [Acidimicrobiales bacterium]|nr:long-chain fatty acid--CoA ligase [Acidimicrobiales bacterium]